MRRFSKRSMLVVLVLPLLTLCACGKSGSAASTDTVTVEDPQVGTGATAASGDLLTVDYVGTLTNGTQFDSSYGRGFSFRLGEGKVIAGWEQGLVGMRVGGKRRLTVPPALGYGDKAVGSIPPNSTLRFEVELLAIAGK